MWLLFIPEDTQSMKSNCSCPCHTPEVLENYHATLINPLTSKNSWKTWKTWPQFCQMAGYFLKFVSIISSCTKRRCLLQQVAQLWWIWFDDEPARSPEAFSNWWGKWPWHLGEFILVLCARELATNEAPARCIWDCSVASGVMGKSKTMICVFV